MHKPEGHNAVSPYLLVADAEQALAFAKAVFGADPSFVARREDGGIMHAEFRIDDSIVMLGQAPGGPECHVHVYVDDPDALIEKALAAGGTLIQAPDEKGDGDRRGGVKDPAGTTWWLARMVDPEGRAKTNAL